MTQEELAKKTRVTQGYIGYLERGLKKNPSLPTLKKAGARPWRASDRATRSEAILAEFANEEFPILSGALKLRMGWPGRKIVGGLIGARIAWRRARALGIPWRELEKGGLTPSSVGPRHGSAK